MRKVLLLLACLLGMACVKAADQPFIRIGTKSTDLIYKVGDNGRLYQCYLGKKLTHPADWEHLPLGTEAYLTHGMEDYFEPALRVLHNDGNPSLLLKYVSHEAKEVSPGVSETVISLKDEQYPVLVKLHFVTYHEENLLKTFTEISHEEKKPVTLYRYASSMLHMDRGAYYLTEFSGDWASETHMQEQRLAFGKKVLDTKLGARANMFCSPFFLLSLDGKAQENAGEVLVGTLGWTGNFRFTFEVDNGGALRLLAGINPYASEYELSRGEVFRTPDFYFTYVVEQLGGHLLRLR